MWLAVLWPSVFGDDEQSARAKAIRERMAPPALALNADDAALIGGTSGELLACEIGGEQQHLALTIHPDLPRGVAGVAGLAAKAHALPDWIRITRAGQDATT
jgi:NADH-quinone oxidoreductase subunit G